MSYIKNLLKVIEEKWLRWFGHVKGMTGNRLGRRMLGWEPEEHEGREEPK
jgi:hypothetical protein